MGVTKRFSLRTILAVSTVIALLLGYGQWRGIYIRRMVDELHNQGVDVSVPDRWWSIAWPPKPEAAELRIEETTSGQFSINAATYSEAEINQEIARLSRRLKSLGFALFLVDATSQGGGRQQVLLKLESNEHTTSQFRLTASQPATQESMEEFLEQLRVQNASRTKATP